MGQTMIVKTLAFILLGWMGKDENRGDSPHTGITSKDYEYAGGNIRYIIKWFLKTGIAKIYQGLMNIIPNQLLDYLHTLLNPLLQYLHITTLYTNNILENILTALVLLSPFERINTILDSITTYTPIAFSRFLGSITTLAGNISTFTESISWWAESNSIYI